MKDTPTAYYAQEMFCDSCGQPSMDLVQSRDGDWLCESCVDQFTCYICGAVSVENALRVFDGQLVKLCRDCADAAKEYDLKPIHDLMHEAINKLNHI